VVTARGRSRDEHRQIAGRAHHLRYTCETIGI
jgi:hypothetical protein